MIVAVMDAEGNVEVWHEDVAAVVHDRDGWIRLIRDGKEDEHLENQRVVVTP